MAPFRLPVRLTLGGYPATLRLWLSNYERWDAQSKRKIALTLELRATPSWCASAGRPFDLLLRIEKRKLTLRGAQSHQAAHRQPDATVPPWPFFKPSATMCAWPTSSASGPPCSVRDHHDEGTLLVDTAFLRGSHPTREVTDEHHPLYWCRSLRPPPDPSSNSCRTGAPCTAQVRDFDTSGTRRPSDTVPARRQHEDTSLSSMTQAPLNRRKTGRARPSRSCGPANVSQYTFARENVGLA